MATIDSINGKEGKKHNINYSRNEWIAWILLCFAVSFMVGIFAPVDLYYSNQDEYWFSLWQMLSVTLIVAVVLFVLLFSLGFFIKRYKAFRWVLGVLFCLFVNLYIQGNYIPRDYGVLDGKDISWNSYPLYALLSIILMLITIAGCIILCRKYKKQLSSIVKYGSIFILLMQIITIGILVFQHMSDSPNKSKIVVTDKDQFVFSEKRSGCR